MGPTQTIADAATTTWTASTATCTTAVPGKYGAVPVDACNSNYGFHPSFETNVAFAVLFGCSMMAHFTQAFVWKKRYCWVVIMGVSWEVIAFIMRSVGARNQQQLSYAIVGQLLFLLAPLWINAFVFMTVARLVYYILPDQTLCRVKATMLTKLLVWFDIVCFIIQAGGGSMMSNEDVTSSIVRTGQQVYMAGCGVQLGFILLFCGMMGRLRFKMSRDSRPVPNLGQVKLLIWIMFAVLTLIIVRIIFRLIEFGKGPVEDNPFLNSEYWAIGLDAVPMLLAFLLLNAVHPGWVLRGPDSEFPRLSRGEKKQLKREKKDAKKAAREAKKEAKEAKKHGKVFAEVQEDTASPSTEGLELLDRDDEDSVAGHRSRV